MAVLLHANKVAAIMTLVGAEYFRRGINRELLAVRFTSPIILQNHLIFQNLLARTHFKTLISPLLYVILSPVSCFSHMHVLMFCKLIKKYFKGGIRVLMHTTI